MADIRWAVACLVLMTLSNAAQPAEPSTSRDSLFARIATVLLHPRCLNCHTAVDYPKQGDDRHAHWFRVVRGADDRGAAGMRCATCHQSLNNTASNVPGAPNWRAAPLPMAWEGKTPAQLCRALLDRRKNGNRSVAQLLDHMSDDPLVAWGWAPGGQRGPVPIAKPEFVALLRRWEEEGARCPR
jgi:hypothetical protein